jgi:hypothetical protein
MVGHWLEEGARASFECGHLRCSTSIAIIELTGRMLDGKAR